MTRFGQRAIGAKALVGLCALVVGCASDPMASIRRDYWDGFYEQAYRDLRELRDDDPQNRQLWDLEMGVLANSVARPQDAVQALRKARDRFEELQGRDFLESFSAMLFDDRSLDYQAADFELVLLRAMLAVCDLMDGGHDALAYAFQVQEQQQRISEAFVGVRGQRPKLRYKLVAFGSYLRAIIMAEDPRRRRLAAKEFRRVLELEPGFRDGRAAVDRAESGHHSAKGHGVLHVIALVGRGPHRVEVRERATRQAITIAQVIWNHHYRHRPTIPNFVDLPIPALAFQRPNPSTVHVQVNGQPRGTTATVTDVDEIAGAEFAAMRSYIMARAIVRRLIKVTAVEAGKEVVGRSGSDRHERHLWQLLIDLVGLIWTAAERADLRCWSLLPQTFQVARIELPEGDHEVVLRAGHHDVPTGAEQRVDVFVRDGYNTYVMVMSPTLRGGPPPLTSLAGDARKPDDPKARNRGAASPQTRSRPQFLKDRYKVKK